MGADVGPLETRSVVDPDTHASRGAENLDQARVGLEVLWAAGKNKAHKNREKRKRRKTWASKSCTYEGTEKIESKTINARNQNEKKNGKKTHHDDNCYQVPGIQ